MSYLDTIEELCQAGLHPGRTCRETKAATGKKLIGCVPYHTPDEVIYAGGCVPVGLWGGNPEFKQADRYLQSFCCGLLRAVVEYSMDGTYSILSGIVVPTFCDSMKCTLENLKLSAPEGMPVLGMSYGQQRKLKAGREYTIREYKRIRHEIEKIAGVAITNEKVEDAFALYEDYRGTMRAFEDAAAEHPEIITAKKRMMIIKAGLFMDKAVYTPKVKEIIAGLKEEGPSAFDGKKIIITGIMAEPAGILDIFEENGLAIAADEMSLGSRLWRARSREDVEDVYERMAYRFADTEADCFMYEPEKLRGQYMLALKEKYDADAVVVMMMKFCDPEQYDYPIYKVELEQAGIPMLYMEVDQQTTGFEQLRTRIQSFREMLMQQ